MTDCERPRGVVGYKLSEEFSGPAMWDGPYAAVFKDGELARMETIIMDPTKCTAEDLKNLSLRLVNTEGVAYLVTHDKPWRWSDYSIDAPFISMWDIVRYVSNHLDDEVDIADHIRTFGARLDSNHHQLYYWVTQ